MLNKNILFVVPTMNSGGVETGIIDLARKNNENKDFNMFLLFSGGILTNRLKSYNVNCINLNVKTKNPITIYKNIKKIKEILINNKIDIVQVESRAPAWSCFYACKALNIPMITTIHGIYNNNCGMFSFIKKKYNSIMFRGNPIICVSKFVEEYALKYFKKYIYKKNFRKDLKVIYRGIDTELFCKKNISVNRILSLQNELKLPDDKIIITIPARFSKQKGQDYFLRVLKYLKSNNYFCLLIGDIKKKPKYVKYIEKLIYQYKLQKYVKIHNNINDIQTLYCLSNILISSSIKPESFGKISIEAQAMEKIFIGTAIGGTLETVINNETGFLAPENNEKNFAKIIDEVLNLTENEKEVITKKARENVIKNFSFEKYYNDLLKVYKELSKTDDFGYRN